MSLATSDIEFLQGLVAKHSGNVIAQRHIYMLEQNLGPIAQMAGLTDASELVARLRAEKDPVLSTEVAEAVTVNETSFFRDQHVFECLRNTIIPALIERNSDSREIRVWSAACSSGQEALSTAMIFRKHFPHLNGWKIKILASDLSEEMLERSRSGEYSELEVNRGLTRGNLIRFFDRKGNAWRAKPEILEMIDYRRMNLIHNWSESDRFDIALVRNVLIYFDQQTKVDVLRRVRRILSPNGYLFIGAAETLIGANAPFRREQIDATVCYRPTESYSDHDSFRTAHTNGQEPV